MKKISRNELQEKMEKNRDLTLVEVLAPEKYEEFHLPRAINVPLGEGFEESVQQAIPDKNAEIVVYCWDEDCDASPKAARKMEQLGYQNVYDYEAGKADWKQAGLPIETGASG